MPTTVTPQAGAGPTEATPEVPSAARLPLPPPHRIRLPSLRPGHRSKVPDLSVSKRPGRCRWVVRFWSAGLLLAGGYQRRRRQPVSGFETAVEVTEGFAQAVGGDEANYEEPVTALAEQVLGIAHERGCLSLRLCGASAGRTKATLLFRGGQSRKETRGPRWRGAAWSVQT